MRKPDQVRRYTFPAPLTDEEAKTLCIVLGNRRDSRILIDDEGKVWGCEATEDDFSDFCNEHARIRRSQSRMVN